MHNGIMIERNLLENCLILEKRETYFLLRRYAPPPPFTFLNPLDLKLKCGTLDAYIKGTPSLIVLLPGKPKNLLCKVD